MRENLKYILATIGVLLLGGAAISYFYYDQLIYPFTVHPIKEVHVHSDFLFYIMGEQVDLSQNKYQSTTTQILSPNIHLHDNIGTEIHRHAEGVTLADFLHSLGFTLTDSCITTDAQKTYCTDSSRSLLLFVNGTVVPKPTTYINQERDRILLYYGDPKDPSIASLLEKVPTDACLYSGTCPERGAPPSESCGLTCNIR